MGEPTTIVGSLAASMGTSEPALKLLLTIFGAYPLALVHRQFFYGKPPMFQHIFLFLSGFTIGYLNFGLTIFHSVFAVLFSYVTLVFLRGTQTCVAITFIFNMAYLLIGYYYSSTNDYDINWTLPQCVLVLRLIGTSYDIYDGNQPEESLSAKNKEVALRVRPTLLEYYGYMFFPGSFLVGPQFPFARYHDFVAGKYSDSNAVGEPPKSCISASLQRFGLGLMYVIIYQAISIFISDDYIVSPEYGNSNFFKRLVVMGIWGRIALYKYISIWLLTEGACILFGLTHNGKDENGGVKWDGLSNVDINRFETATEFNHYIQSFNTNTNHWVAQYIYKRLKFAGNRYVSQFSALLFLAIWHGFHTGYYVCFFFEFMVMVMEKDIHSVLAKNPQVPEFFSKYPAKGIFYLVQRAYTFVFMGWCMMPFNLLTFERYWTAFSNVNFAGAILFLPWLPIYGKIFRIIVNATKPKTPHTD